MTGVIFLVALVKERPVNRNETPRKRHLPLFITTLIIWCASALPHPMPAVADKWSLWTGETQLRGANIYQRRVYPELDGPTFMGPGPVGPPYTQQDFDRLAALGANYVNISHPGLFAEAPPYTLDQGIQANLDMLLDMISKANMFAVISFRAGPGRSEFTFFWEEVGDWFNASYLNDSVWQNQTAQDAWVAMWAYTAQRYEQNSIVVGYDLMVEPNSNEVGSHPLNDPLDIWDPEEFYNDYGGTLYDWNQLYPRITLAIRGVDTETPILVGGNAYSAVDWLPYVQPTGDLRTVYTVHQYDPYVYTHQEPPLGKTYPGVFDTDWDGQPDTFNKAWLASLLSTVDAFKTTYSVPVAANEFGLMRWEPGAASFMDDQMDLFEARGMNYALWLWETSWQEFAEEVDAFNFRHGPNPNNHTDVQSSALMDVIIAHWGQNTVRPSGEMELAPTVTISFATQVTPVSARLNGRVNPNGKDTTYYFEYGITGAYGSSTPIMDAGSCTAAISASADITGLVLNTTYHYRIVATNSVGTSYGSDRTFVARERKAMPWTGLLLCSDN